MPMSSLEMALGTTHGCLRQCPFYGPDLPPASQSPSREVDASDPGPCLVPAWPLPGPCLALALDANRGQTQSRPPPACLEVLTGKVEDCGPVGLRTGNLAVVVNKPRFKRALSVSGLERMLD